MEPVQGLRDDLKEIDPGIKSQHMAQLVAYHTLAVFVVAKSREIGGKVDAPPQQPSDKRLTDPVNEPDLRVLLQAQPRKDPIRALARSNRKSFA
jgi:hypothetical protein